MTKKQELFCTEYLVDFNATRAAIAAGYSEESARVIGCENLTKPDIREYIQKQVEIILGPAEKDIIENNKFWQSMRDDPEAPETARIKASELIGKYRSMFVEKREVEHSGEIVTTVKSWGEIMGGDGPEA